MSTIPADLQWQLIRKNSAFRHRRRNIQKHFSTEPFNLKGVNSIRYNGLVHDKGIDVRPAKDKGIVLITKNKKKQNYPMRSTSQVTLTKNSRKTLKTIKNVAKQYKPSQIMLAQRRASQILRSQKPLAARQGRRARKFKTESN